MSERIPRQPSHQPPDLIGCCCPRWVEEDPKEILQSVYECMERTCEKLSQLNIDITNIKGAEGSFSTAGKRFANVSACLNVLSDRSDQPTRDHAGLGQGDGRAPLQRHW